RAALQQRSQVAVGPSPELHEARQIESLAWLPRHVRRDRRWLVVRADVLANIAPIHVIAERGAVLVGDAGSKLDRQVRNAAGRIEDAGVDERTGRAGVKTAPARSALLECLRVGFEWKRRDDLREEQPGAMLRVDQARVLANPSKARVLRVDALLHRARIDVRARVEGF